MGKFGLSLTAVGVLAFVLGFFGFIEILVLVVGFCVIAEKDKWLMKQSLQALYLRIVYSIITVVIGWVFSAFIWFFRIVRAMGAMSVMADIQSFVNGALYLGLFALSVVAVLNLLKGKNASIPFVEKLVDYTLGVVKPKKTTVSTPSTSSTYAASTNTFQQPPPVYGQEPAQVSPSKTEDALKEGEQLQSRTREADDGTWICSCGQENQGNFCISCGNQKTDKG